MKKTIKYKKHKKRFLELFLAFMMIFGITSFVAPTMIVSAAGPYSDWITLRTDIEKMKSGDIETFIISSDISYTGSYYIEIPTGAKVTLTSNSAVIINVIISSRAFVVKSNAELTINGDITFTNPNGSFFEVAGTVTMNNGKITGNKGTNGGGVNIESSGKFFMYDGEISNNTANSSGGGLNVDGEFIMYNGAIFNNKATKGGGICINGGIIEIYAGYFYGNKSIGSAEDGGAIGTGGSTSKTSKIHNAVIVGNSATHYGGGIYSCTSGYVEIEEKSIIIGGNSATGRGAQLCIERQNPYTVIPEKMIGGADYEWYWDMGGKRYSPTNQIKFKNGYFPKETGTEYDGYAYDSSGLNLTNTISTVANLATLEALYPKGKVFIFNNSAVDGGGVGGNGSISFVADEPAPDKNKLVVHKYIMSDLSLATTPWSGKEVKVEDLPPSARPLGGITFKLYEIIYTGTPPTDKFDFNDSVSPPTLTSNKIVYSLKPIGDPIITAENTGVATFDNLDDGLYLIVEVPSPNITPISPCIIKLPFNNEEDDIDLKEVHIYPKNKGETPVFPETGGPGTFAFTFAGVILTAFPLVMLAVLYKKSRLNLKEKKSII